ncbi:hypothetical protein BH23PLA1_BH23PLA1_39540 [soil metagenome]
MANLNPTHENLDSFLDLTHVCLAIPLDTPILFPLNDRLGERTPAPLAVLGGTAGEFAESLLAIRRELAPTSALESLLADLVVLSSARLRRAAEAEAAGEPSDSWAPLALLGERTLLDALQALEACKNRDRDLQASRWGRPAPEVSCPFEPSEPLPYPCDETIIPWVDGDLKTEDESDLDFDHDLEPSPTADHHWRSRLIFEEQVSGTSPVVRGTWVTAGQVVTLIVDGWTWDDILRAHPELTEDDIRACLDYTVEEESPLHLD